jgi:hypothetical protein
MPAMPGQWIPAQRAWDGVRKIEMAGPYLDNRSVDDGALFIFGGPAAGGLDPFFNDIAGHFRRFHGCTQAQGRRDIKIGGLAAVAFTQTCAGQLFARTVIARDRIGLVAFLSVNFGAEDVALDHLIGWLGGLEWTTT